MQKDPESPEQALYPQLLQKAITGAFSVECGLVIFIRGFEALPKPKIL
jgi:hypothetical protein